MNWNKYRYNTSCPAALWNFRFNLRWSEVRSLCAVFDICSYCRTVNIALTFRLGTLDMSGQRKTTVRILGSDVLLAVFTSRCHRIFETAVVINASISEHCGVFSARSCVLLNLLQFACFTGSCSSVFCRSVVNIWRCCSIPGSRVFSFCKCAKNWSVVQKSDNSEKHIKDSETWQVREWVHCQKLC
jgi:hypothetical protein